MTIGLSSYLTVAAILFTVGMLGIFLWQTGRFLRRNKPGIYTPDQIPIHALP